MKIIIVEQQVESLLHEMLNNLFKGYKMRFEDDVRNFYVGDKLLMTVKPTMAIIDKSILKRIEEVFFFQTVKDMKDEIRSWINNNFGIRKTAEKLLGVQFQNLNGEIDLPKEKKKPVRDKSLPKEKKSEEQIKREREGYSKFLKHRKEFEKNLKEQNADWESDNLYSEEDEEGINKIMSRLSLPYVKKYSVKWDKIQGMYKVNLYYDVDDSIDLDQGNHVEKNENKVKTISKFLGLPQFTFAVRSMF